MKTTIEDVKRVTCIGTGTIGSGWASYYLSQGFEVIASDPGNNAEESLNRQIDEAWPVVMQLNPSKNADRNALRFTTSVEDAVSDTDFIQESAPEREDLKISLFQQIDAAAPANCVIASSSSAFLPSRLASQCTRPERCIIGHPFAPSYLMPLVEVLGGEKTDTAVVDWVMAFYNHIGKKALRLQKEIDSYIANRFQDVVLNEATAMVEAGICNFDDIDAAMSFGPGLRWAFAGPAMCYHLGGGKGGVKAMIEQFGFNGSEAAKQNMIDSIERMSKGKSIDELEQWRNENLLTMITQLRMTGD